MTYEVLVQDWKAITRRKLKQILTPAMKTNTQFLMWLPKYESLLPIHTYELAALSILH